MLGVVGVAVDTFLRLPDGFAWSAKRNKSISLAERLARRAKECRQRTLGVFGYRNAPREMTVIASHWGLGVCWNRWLMSDADRSKPVRPSDAVVTWTNTWRVFLWHLSEDNRPRFRRWHRMKLSDLGSGP